MTRATTTEEEGMLEVAAKSSRIGLSPTTIIRNLRTRRLFRRCSPLLSRLAPRVRVEEVLEKPAPSVARRGT